jgi:hypothetical protein
MRLCLVLFAMLAATACAAPSATDLVVPQDGVHVAGAAQMFFPASPAGQCQSRTYPGATGKNVTSLSYNNQTGPNSGTAKSMYFYINGYRGAGSYPIDKVVKPGTSIPPISPDQTVGYFVVGAGAAWIADGGTIVVLVTGGTVRGTVNAPKTWAKGGPTTANASIQGSWACTVLATPTPIMIEG